MSNPTNITIESSGATALQPGNTLSGMLASDTMILPTPVEGGFHNFTELRIPRELATVLSWGPNFVPYTAPSVKNLGEVLCYTSSLMFNIRESGERAPQDPDHLMRGPERANLFSNLQAAVRDGITPTLMDRTVVEMVKVSTRYLNNHEEVCVIQGDKGQTTALMYLADYKIKLDEYVNTNISRGVYRPLTQKDPEELRSIPSAEYNDLVKTIHTCYKTCTLDTRPFPNRVMRNLLSYTFHQDQRRYPRLYGTLKCHKEGRPCIPICDTQDWYTYPLQRMVSHILNTTFRDLLDTHNVGNVEAIIPELTGLILMQGYEFVKYDVKDMYISLFRPDILRVVTALCNTEIYRTRCQFPLELLLRTFNYCFEVANVFSYDRQLYTQLEGLPQGGCDSSILATMYLDYKLQLYDAFLFQNHHIVYWYKYMDEILVYMPISQIESFKKEFERLVRLEITAEREERTNESLYPQILFMDVLITRREKEVLVGTYRKPTASMRMINYLSNDPLNIKHNITREFIQKVLRRSSNNCLIHDLEMYERQFRANYYPDNYVSRVMEQTLKSHIASLNTTVCTAAHNERISILSGFLVKHGLRDPYPKAKKYKTV